MSTVDAAMLVVHNLFAAVWAGSVLFVALAVVPLATDGDLGPDPLYTIVDRFRLLSRVSAFVLLATGSYLGLNGYVGDGWDVSPLIETGRGHLVLTMIVLWFALAAVVEIGSSKLLGGLDRNLHREPARNAVPWYRGAALLALLVLLVGAVLSSGLVA